MAEGFGAIIAELERHKTAIEQALAALRDAVDAIPPATSGPATASPNRRSEGQKKRWAAKKAAESAPAPVQKPKRRISPEGLKRIIAATKKRWRLKRADTAAKRVSSTVPSASRRN